MGPRLDRRGNAHPGGGMPPEGGLQWGHAWIGVGIALWAGQEPLNEKLQWGHAWIGVGMCGIHRLRKRRYLASMGPRLDRRGNQGFSVGALCVYYLLQWGHAWIGVGIMMVSRWWFSVPRLQWGHAWIGVGIVIMLAKPSSPRLLQWGHAWIGVGILQDKNGGQNDGEASMGPRLDRRGNR